MNPPIEHPYEIINEELSKSTTASEKWRLQQMLTTEEFGNCRPP